jgi:uncharacterized repeat protein (TIGR01451 family)
MAATSTVAPISFTGETINYAGYTPSVADLNGDGWLDVLGTMNNGNNVLVPISADAMGLQNLFSPGRVHRDARVADFNGDGYPDIVANTYSSIGANDSVAMLYFNNGNGTFTEEPQFTQLAIKGYGETIVVADFDNDNDLDIYLPYYSHNSASEHSYLLINDGSGQFIDIADSAGVSLRNRPMILQPEGAQAIDFNLDGWIDFYVSGHLFQNNGNLTFTDVRSDRGLPERFDEGIKFLDWNNDGYMDLIIHHPTTGPALYQFNGATFNFSNVIPSYAYSQSYGLNIYDLNNDGREDIFTSGGTSNNTMILLNNGNGFERSNPTQMDFWGNDLIAFGDINRDGRIDVLKRSLGEGLKYFRNTTSVPQQSFLYVDVVGLNGERNQQGRVVRITPQNHPATTFTRVVDGGSGYMAQNQYELLVGTSFVEPHIVQVYSSGRVIEFEMMPGEKRRVFQDGTISPYVDPNDLWADLSVASMAGTPDPVAVNDQLTYTLIVRNNGPGNANGVTVTSTLPSGVTFESATVSPGSCSGTSTLTCSLGTLANGASRSVTIVVTVNVTGVLTNTATVSADETDPFAFNNNATAQTNGDARMASISTRAFVGTQDNVAVGGLIIGGTGTKQVLIRGFGPTLSSFGVTDALANPVLELYQDTDSDPTTPAVLLVSNDNWGTDITVCPAPIVACGTAADIANTGKSADTYAPANPNRHSDAALLVTLPPGTYTAMVRGAASGTGVGLVAVNDVDPTQTATLQSISTRAFVGTGDNEAVGGLIITGTTERHVLIRGLGPTLSSFGVTGALANPVLELYQDTDNDPTTPAVLLMTNNDWRTDETSCLAPIVACGSAADIAATGKSADSYAPNDPDRRLDAALLVTLPPGTYTAKLRGVSGGTGVGLVAVNEIEP